MTILELREAIWKKDEIKKNALVVFALLIEKIFFHKMVTGRNMTSEVQTLKRRHGHNPNHIDVNKHHFMI